MARNSEKAMTALARWRRAKEEEEGTAKKHVKRPYLASECDNVQDAERWRQQTIRDISKSVTAIQNAGLGEFRIRDLNDHINKLLREKKHWENRIRELGGKSYSSKGAKMLDREGKEVPGNKGYKYFGAARDLPGVRELFESDAPVNTKKTRAELMKDVDAQYYGFRDDDDGLLVPLELKAEKEATARLIEEWKGTKGGGGNTEEADDEEDLYMKEVKNKDEDEALREAMEAGKEGRFIAHVKVPTQKDIEEALLRRKKQELLELYAIDSTDLDQMEKEAKMEPKEMSSDETEAESAALIEVSDQAIVRPEENPDQSCTNQISTSSMEMDEDLEKSDGHMNVSEQPKSNVEQNTSMHATDVEVSDQAIARPEENPDQTCTDQIFTSDVEMVENYEKSDGPTSGFEELKSNVEQVNNVEETSNHATDVDMSGDLEKSSTVEEKSIENTTVTNVNVTPILEESELKSTWKDSDSRDVEMSENPVGSSETNPEETKTHVS